MREPHRSGALAGCFLGAALDQADQVALRVLELAQLDLVHDLLRAHDPGPAEALGLGPRGLDVGDLHVEGHVSVVSLRALPDAAADPHAVGVAVAVALDDPVAHRVARIDLPAEELRVVALQLLPVLPDDFEVNYRLSHCFPPSTSAHRRLVNQMPL